MKKEDVLKNIGLRIRQLREERNITQQVLAAECNFEKSNMSRIESGGSNFTIATLLKICEVLKVKLSDIVEGVD